MKENREQNNALESRSEFADYYQNMKKKDKAFQKLNENIPDQYSRIQIYKGDEAYKLNALQRGLNRFKDYKDTDKLNDKLNDKAIEHHENRSKAAALLNWQTKAVVTNTLNELVHDVEYGIKDKGVHGTPVRQNVISPRKKEYSFDDLPPLPELKKNLAYEPNLFPDTLDELLYLHDRIGI